MGEVEKNKTVNPQRILVITRRHALGHKALTCKGDIANICTDKDFNRSAVYHIARIIIMGHVSDGIVCDVL
jgi:hypothetical protein